MNSPLTVLTLVHGTFARGARWTHEDSALVQGLRRKIGDCVVPRFLWSGRNGHGARLQAGQELRKHLAEQKRAYPHAEHIVIAHSHGGNVALYAQRDAGPEATPDGIACLATPFISCTRRELAPTLKLMELAAPLLAVVLGIVLSALGLLAIVHFWTESLQRLPDWVLLLGGLWLVLAWFKLLINTALAAHRWSAHRLPAWVNAKAAALHLRLRSPPGRVPPLFIASHPQDEAALWLRLGAGTVEVPFRFWSRSAQGGARLGAILLKTWLPFLVILGIGGGVAGMIWGADAAAAVALGGAWVLQIGFALAAVTALAIAMMIVVPRLRANPAMFGWESLTDNLLAAITPRRVPELDADVTLRTPSDPVRRGFVLLHSAIYEDAKVIEALADWINRLLAKLPAKN